MLYSRVITSRKLPVEKNSKASTSGTTWIMGASGEVPFESNRKSGIRDVAQAHWTCLLWLWVFVGRGWPPFALTVLGVFDCQTVMQLLVVCLFGYWARRAVARELVVKSPTHRTQLRGCLCSGSLPLYQLTQFTALCCTTIVIVNGTLLWCFKLLI
jgi:hypothetical protein